ncbi:arsenical pump-driving ATPase [Deferrisoma camini]|uniref:arsenical pump-driving ATPase n=1 Tax=Deferrisoma camini TaxID=1035120 RepID=UPI0004B35675|nr:arsenical pump-driving ATPase [Deferrisoma camini]
MEGFLDRVPRHVFFTGKGGVGKTTLASATAVALADAGRRVLLVCTDPASNLDEVLGTPLGLAPRPVNGVDGLYGVNVDPEEAARAYRERVLGPVRGVLPEEAVRSIEEQLSGACTVEIAAFGEFARLLGDPEATDGFDHVVFDTAPTGHTLRLLELPAAWTQFIATNVTGTSCLGPLSGLREQEARFRAALERLADPDQTEVVLVARPDRASLAEAGRASAELAALGLGNQCLVVNGVFRAQDPDDPVARAWEARVHEALEALPPALRGLQRWEVSLRPYELVGAGALRSLWNGQRPPAEGDAGAWDANHQSLDALVEGIAAPGRGLVLTMGKGGVGKTTVALELVRRLAETGRPVHFTTTDPAGRRPLDLPAGVTATRIDPKAETRAYAAEVMETVGGELDEEGRALLAEDLRSPCTEEIAVFRAFAREAARSEQGFVVVDTAPTGHTLLLLDAAQAYHREVLRSRGDLPETVRRLLPRLRDPELTRVLLVTLPEATPVHEAASLEADLRRAGIEPYAWVLNQSLTPLPVTDPLLRARRRAEARYVRDVLENHPRVFVLPWSADPRPDPDPGKEGR